MAEIADAFGGKVNGELIRAADWNGLIDAIEARFAALETGLGQRIDALGARLDGAEARLGVAEAALGPLQAVATALLSRQRRIDLTSTRAVFAIGERAEIVARVADFLGQPLDLTNAAARPWVDFVTVWGTLKAAPGFVSVVGTGGRTVTVQVNGAGEARALLRAEAAEVLAEEQELEVAAVLDTTIGSATIASAFLAASTPGNASLQPAFEAVSLAYERPETPVMRNYLDSVYLARPSRSYTQITPAFVLNWRDEHATVLAFVKPDDSPSSADAAMAVGSIRVAFRDWVYPWITDHYLPPRPLLVDDYRGRFSLLLQNGFEPAVGGILDHVQTRTLSRGLLGTQKELAAAQVAISTLPVTNPPAYLPGVVQAVAGGLTVQQGLLYSQAVAPLVPETTAPAKAIGTATARGEAVATSAAAAVRAETGASITASEGRVLDAVRAENVRFSNDLLRDDGPVRRAESLAQQARSEVIAVKADVGAKADFALVNRLLIARGGGG
ncbi:MAG: hypothetical protein K2X49_01515 [Acetobacteraceae bacterium]|nr:hypothetical protein [Acetobacteraceae bacterium]